MVSNGRHRTVNTMPPQVHLPVNTALSLLCYVSVTANWILMLGWRNYKKAVTISFLPLICNLKKVLGLLVRKTHI